MLKGCADQLADVLTDIFNISLSSATVPSCFKTTIIIPVPKKSPVVTVVGLIDKNNESSCREKVEQLITWCKVNNLFLNIYKTKEMVVDFQRAQRDHEPLNIHGSPVEIVKNTKFLGVHLTENLT